MLQNRCSRVNPPEQPGLCQARIGSTLQEQTTMHISVGVNLFDRVQQFRKEPVLT